MTIAPIEPLKVDQPTIVPDPEWWDDEDTTKDKK